jgi:adenosine deaminase
VQAHVRAGVPFRRVLDGVTAGIRRAHRELGVTSRVLVALDRGTTSAEEAVEFVRQTADYGDELVCGFALSGAEGDGPPERFAAAFQLAEREGLHRANHVCEDNQTVERAPAANYLTSRDLLHCERYYHGNNLVSDSEVLAEAARDGAVFNVVTFTSAESRRASRRASIRTMKDAGLRLTVNSDDPAMFGVTVRDCYQTLFDESGWGLDELRETIGNGFEASWLSETERRAALARVDAAFTALA